MDQDEKDQSGAYPAPPDLKKVHALRARLRSDKSAMESAGSGPESRRNRKVGKSAKDIGTYTLIPSLMIAGPLVGYVLGYLVEKYIGGAPWGVAGGVLLGVVAGFRQVFLLLTRVKEAPPGKE